MPTAEKSFQEQSGFSLVELLVVIAIISVVAALAMMQRGSANEQFQRQNAARELKVAFERARFDSVKRRADGSGAAPFAYVELTQNSFTLRTYRTDVNGAATPNDQVYTFPTGVVAEGYAFSLGSSNRIDFNRRGEATISGGGNPSYMICNGTCPTAPGTSDVSNTVLVTPTGTVNMLGGGIAIEDFANVTGQASISNSSGIRTDVVIP